MNEEFDTTFIEILPEDKINDFLEIDDRIFKRYKSYKAPILKSVLSGRQHTTYLNHPRPYSIVLNRNPWYDVMNENCMQRCAYGLQFGRLYNRKNQ